MELAKLASAVTHITEDDAPLLVFHGGKDNVVLQDQSERIVSLYKEAKLPVEYVYIPEGGHGGDLFYKERAVVKGLLNSSRSIGLSELCHEIRNFTDPCYNRLFICHKIRLYTLRYLYYNMMKNHCR